jgi:hypothetical protein
MDAPSSTFFALASSVPHEKAASPAPKLRQSHFSTPIHSRKLRAGELGLLTSLESILASIWVWIGIGKTSSATVLLGGSVVLAAVIGLTASEHLPLLPPTAAKQSR